MVNNFPFVKGESVKLEIKGLEENILNEGLKITLYRIIQEQLNNIIKYSSATIILVSLTQNRDKLNVLIQDNGQGFDLKARRKGIGLANITSRAELYNGHAVIESKPGAGCKVSVIFEIASM